MSQKVLSTVLLFLLLTFFKSTLHGQSYWQQEVNYSISVTLDDVQHTLTGFETFEYINNSPNTLDKIYIHVWPNAYKDDNSALAQQKYGHGDEILKFTKDQNKGWIDSLDFQVDGKKANWYFHHHQDIIILELPTPLDPNQRIKISTPFFVKIPSGYISRLGHLGQSYQITQWYPKPAVYDKDGWHHMPYLDQGEFYSEYGSFDVKITLPDNYIVGATGDLQTPSEIEFMDSLANQTVFEEEKVEGEKFGSRKNLNKTPVSSVKLKTIHFKQTNVHDFAWFADKRYQVLKGEVILPNSKRAVTTWALFTPKNAGLWKNSIEYINDATYYYSLWNGDYPYNQVTAVDGTISAGAGMEYPNVTVIGNSSDAMEHEIVIVHEVGHNWFYGQLGSNERVHGWMDEGLNTLNEMRYMRTKYPRNQQLSDMILGGAFHFNDLSHYDMGDYSYRLIAGMGEDQPIETHSNDFTEINYGIIMYQKTGLVFFYLKDYLGNELFDKCMQTYYSEWEFKHPTPTDLQTVFERVSKKDLEWFFQDLIKTTNHIDYKVSKVKKKTKEVVVKNVGQVNGPIQVNAFKDGELVQWTYTEPGEKKTTVQFTEEFDAIKIDPYHYIPEINRQNNNWKSKGLFKKLESPKFEFLIGDNESDATNIFWTPIIGGNYYDKFMIGIGIHNYGIPFNRLQFLLMPYYSFGRNFVSGIGELSYTTLPKEHLKLSKFGLSVKSFKHDTTYRHNSSYFLTIAPYWMAKIGQRKNDSPYRHTIRIQSLYRKDQFGPQHIEHVGGFAAYEFNYLKPDHKVDVLLRNDYLSNVNSSDQMARILLEANYSYRYTKRKMNSWISIRAFIGKYYISDFNSNNSYQYSMSLAGADGRQDLFVDEYYFGRNNTEGIWSQQRQENMGGFKSTSDYGTTSDLMTTANLYIQLPLRPGFIGVFADYGIFWNGGKANAAANVGLALRIGEVFGVYFPVWMSKELENSYDSLNYAERIRFTLKFNLTKDGIGLKGLL